MKLATLEKYRNLIGAAGTIIGLLSLAAFGTGYYFNGQIYQYFQSVPTPTSSNTITATSTTSTSISQCTVHPCSYTVVISETGVVSEWVSGYVFHVVPASEAKTAWEMKDLFDSVGTVLLVISVILSLIAWELRHHQ